jgi:hypothetical protein
MNYIPQYTRSWHKNMKNCKSVNYYGGNNECFMYFMGRQVLNASVPQGYVLVYLKGICLYDGDIKPFIPNDSLEGAMQKTEQTLKNPRNYCLWYPIVKSVIHKYIEDTKGFAM